MKQIAHFFSWVFLPLFTPMYALFIVFFIPTQPKNFYLYESLYHYPAQIKTLYLLLFLVFVVLAPGMSLLVLRYNKSISSLSLEKREERKTPIAIMFFYSIVLYLFLIFQEDATFIPKALKGMALGGGIAIGIAYLANKYEKISLHGLGVGALLGFLYAYFLGLETYDLSILIVAIMVGALTLSARLYLKCHTLKQIGLGYMLGFGTQVLTIYFYP